MRALALELRDGDGKRTRTPTLDAASVACGVGGDGGDNRKCYAGSAQMVARRAGTILTPASPLSMIVRPIEI